MFCYKLLKNIFGLGRLLSNRPVRGMAWHKSWKRAAYMTAQIFSLIYAWKGICVRRLETYPTVSTRIAVQFRLKGLALEQGSIF